MEARSQRPSLLYLLALRLRAPKHHRSTTRAPLALAVLAARAVFILSPAVFRTEIADAIKMCFERPSHFVTEYMDENFELAH
jgi:hypothetical protein